MIVNRQATKKGGGGVEEELNRQANTSKTYKTNTAGGFLPSIRGANLKTCLLNKNLQFHQNRPQEQATL